ncbi:MAG: xanthine dehydrogenase family protein subunit M [Syntrophobacteraceae bacterium]
MMSKFDYIRPKSIDEALSILAPGDAVVHAGGTDLLGCLREHIFEVKTLVSLGNLRELKGIQKTREGGLWIGALTTITEVAEDPRVREMFPGLAGAAFEVGSPQLRNQGTLGGNLCQKPRCWYYRGDFHCLRKGGDTCFAVGGENRFHCIFGGDSCYIVHPSDTAPILSALDATVHIEGPRGGRDIPVGEFHVPPGRDPQRETVLEQGELITGIFLPPPPAGLRSSYRKVRARQSWDFALAGVALALVQDAGKVAGAKVVLSGVAPVPWRLTEVENLLAGRKLDWETLRLAAETAVKGAGPMEQNAYKLPLVKALIEEELTAISTG